MRLLATAGAALALAACGGSDHFDFDRSSKDLAGQKVAAAQIGLPTTGAAVTSVETPTAATGAQPPRRYAQTSPFRPWIQRRQLSKWDCFCPRNGMARWS